MGCGEGIMKFTVTVFYTVIADSESEAMEKVVKYNTNQDYLGYNIFPLNKNPEVVVSDVMIEKQGD